MNKRKNTISVYACGGTGINLATKVLACHSSVTGFPDTEINLIDTSESNLDKERSKGKGIYLIPGLDGSGKNRKFGHENAVPHVNKILVQFKPKDFSIVIFSTSGGSGSILGPLLIKELLERNENVVAFCIGSVESGKETENTLKTIASLQGISKNLNKSIVAKFYLNDNDNTRNMVDRQVENDYRALTIMLSGLNEGLDDQDIHNFLNYSKVVDVKPQLVDLLFFTRDDKCKEPSGFTAIAVANLLVSTDDKLLLLDQPYGCTGYMPSGLTDAYADGLKPMFFILTNALMKTRLETYMEVMKAYEAAKDRLDTVSSVDIGEADGDGFYF